jgi:pseudouridine kinase
MTETNGYVLVIGSACTEIKAHVPDTESLQWDHATLGEIRSSVSGTARNIAENLARLEVRTVLLSAIGRDAPGRRVYRQTRKAGVRCKYVRVIDDERTSTSVTLLRPDGEPAYVISDYRVMEHIDREYLEAHESLFARADMIVIDATLSEEALATVFSLAARHNVRVSADPTAPLLASRLCPYVSQLFIVTPNATETTALCGIEDPARDRDAATDAARQLNSMGAQISVVTLGDQGVAYASSGGGGYIRAVKVPVVDSTGGGDAFSGAVIFGLLNAVEIDEAMRLGMTAAALTVGSRETVVPTLSQEMLYDNLVI